jgi:nitroreductase
MDCIEVLKTRRSVRGFQPEQVPEHVLMDILDTGRLASTAGNFQPWEFYVINDSSIIQQLPAAANDQQWLATAPVVIVVCADPQKSAQYGERGMNYYCLLDCAIATQNMLLAAHNYGYGGCWVGGFSERKMRNLLGIPADIRVVSIVPIGRTAGEQWIAPKRELREMLHINKW